MNFWTHGMVGFSALYVPASLIAPEPVALVAGIASGILCAWPDVDGEREKWEVKAGTVETEVGGVSNGGRWVFSAIRNKYRWTRYGRWHTGDLRAWARKYWILPILFHVDATDPLIHKPTWIVDKEKHPTLYSIIWWVLDLSLLALAILSLINIVWWWTLLGVLLTGWIVSLYRARQTNKEVQ